MYSIYSTLPAATRYVHPTGLKKGTGSVAHAVLIRGAHRGTPARTVVSAEDYAWLGNDPHFQRHVTGGFLEVRPMDAPPTRASEPVVTAPEPDKTGNGDAPPVIEAAKPKAAGKKTK